MLVANRLWLSVVSDELTPNGEAQVISAKDYYPFGMSMPSRTTEGGTYRYGFNGKETDQETGIQDYGMRWYTHRKSVLVNYRISTTLIF